jgi:hypothetical protein
MTQNICRAFTSLLGYVILTKMRKKFTHIFLSILILWPLFAGTAGFPLPDNSSLSFENLCGTNHCTNRSPVCPLCPTSGSFVPYLSNGSGIIFPVLNSSLTHTRDDTLSDQGVVKAIFHPPTSVL